MTDMTKPENLTTLGADQPGMTSGACDDPSQVQSGLPPLSCDRNRALEAAHARMREMREQGIQVERLNPTERWKRDPTSLAKAIFAKCYECGGSDSDPDWQGRIRNCKCPKCPLWNVRPYNKVTVGRRVAINAKCRRCMGDECAVQRVRECDIVTCSLHPVRPYQEKE